MAVLAVSASPAFAADFRYIRVGNKGDAQVAPAEGFALMGGGADLDEAFRWLCDRAHGGDFLILRATGSDDYNPYVQKLCHLNSVATLILPNRAAANEPEVAAIIRHAGALFISGGDQANYINFWMNTPVQAALNESIGRGVPIGGTSAGLAVLGEYAYSAQGDKPDDPNLDGKTALLNPLHPRITLVRGFLDVPLLKGIITDTHFARRDRMGRLLAFLARLNEPDARRGSGPETKIRGLGVEEKAAVLLEPDGKATVVGKGSAYLIEPRVLGNPLTAGEPLSSCEFDVQRVGPGQSFDVKKWTGNASRYVLSVQKGIIHSSQPDGSVY